MNSIYKVLFIEKKIEYIMSIKRNKKSRDSEK